MNRLFQCYNHPGNAVDPNADSKSSLRAYPGILCGDSDHTPLILMGLAFGALYIILPLAKLYFVVKTSGSDLNTMRYYFLIARFGVDKIHWSFLALLRYYFKKQTINSIKILMNGNQY